MCRWLKFRARRYSPADEETRLFIARFCLELLQKKKTTVQLLQALRDALAALQAERERERPMLAAAQDAAVQAEVSAAREREAAAAAAAESARALERLGESEAETLRLRELLAAAEQELRLAPAGGVVHGWARRASGYSAPRSSALAGLGDTTPCVAESKQATHWWSLPSMGRLSVASTTSRNS